MQLYPDNSVIGKLAMYTWPWNRPTWGKGSVYRRPRRVQRQMQAITYARKAAYGQRWGNVIPRTRRFRRGFNRTGGYYGRYNGHTHARAELKFLDGVVSDNPVASTGNLTSTVLVIPQGTGESQRIGRKCTVKKFSWQYTLTFKEQTSGAVTHDEIKLIVYLDTQANGASAGVTDILETNNIHSFRNLANSHRIKVLAVRQHSLHSVSGAGDGADNDYAGMSLHGRIDIDCNYDIEYGSGVTGALSEIQSNNIGILLISLAARTFITSRFRVRFIG